MPDELAVRVPYRLDLTVNVLRRLSTNVVDVLAPDGQYVRALNGPYGPMIARVTQVRPETLAVTVTGDRRDIARVLSIIRRVLGVDRDLTHFSAVAAGISWLRPLALRMLGVKPPRYPTLWEAVVNAVAFQQVSLHAASAIVRRLIVTYSPPVERDGIVLHAFPSIETVVRARDDTLRAIGFSANKIATLRRAGAALASGTLDDAMLEERPSPDAAALLQQIKGIGPWTASVILLRGLGRLDVFPRNDSGVERNLALVAGEMPLDVDRVLDALAPQQGMLYYHLLLARLEARGELGRGLLADATENGATDDRH